MIIWMLCLFKMTLNEIACANSLNEAMKDSKRRTFSYNHENGTVIGGEFSRIMMKHAKRLKYLDSQEDRHMRTQLHWGQLKLLLSEIEFLTLVLKQYQQSGSNKQITLVYAGAAPGDHILVLAELFPTVNFVLYDPSPFNPALYRKRRIVIFTGEAGMFKDTTASFWGSSNPAHEDKYIVFVTDIRNISVDRVSEREKEDLIQRDMVNQRRWWSLMQPELATFKFRLRFTEGVTEYMEGVQYLQAYPTLMSAETRLVVKKGACSILYNHTQQEEQCFYHNSIVRPARHGNVYGVDVSNFRCNLDKCYDCTSFVFIVGEYRATVGKTVDPESIMTQVRELELKASPGKNLIDAHAIHQSQHLAIWRQQARSFVSSGTEGKRQFVDTGRKGEQVSRGIHMMEIPVSSNSTLRGINSSSNTRDGSSQGNVNADAEAQGGNTKRKCVFKDTRVRKDRDSQHEDLTR